MVVLRTGSRVLVTGATGFVGRILSPQLSDRGYLVTGLASTERPSDLRAYGVSDYTSVDLAKTPHDDTDFDAVVHLAGLAQVGPSFSEPQRYIALNSAMVTNLCEPLLAAGSRARIIIVSTGAVYGAGTRAGEPINESTAPTFNSPYVVSKVLAENQAAYYRARGLDTVVARPFNHIGPGQRPGFIVPDLTEKLSRLAPGTTLDAGNLSAERDYTDVRDVARAYVSLLEADELAHHTYNVASGISRSGWEVLEAIARELELPVPETRTSYDRAIDPSSIGGDASRLIAETGWEPTFAFEESVRDYCQGAR